MRPSSRVLALSSASPALRSASFQRFRFTAHAAIGLATLVVIGAHGLRTAPPVAMAQAAPIAPQRWPGAELGKGTVLSETSPRYTVYSLKFTGGRPIELHDEDTDIVFVMGGAGTVVSGGTVVGKRALKDKEWTGTDIQGGTTTEVSKGSVLLLPKGVPHWFKSVTGSLEFYAVKVNEAGAPADQNAARTWTRAEVFKPTPQFYNGGDAHRYQLFAVARNGAGIPEVHDKEIDLVFVLDGTGTWVVGGAPADKTRLAGGSPLRIGPNDGVMVPARMHHWFSEASTLSYYAMKVW